MPNFKPFAIVNEREFSGEIRGKYKRFNTYREVKKALPELITQSVDSQVHVLRSRRGEWGEWNEYWEFNHDQKPVIVKQGWS